MPVIDSCHIPAIPADGSFVFKIGLAMILNTVCGDGEVGRRYRLMRQLPREQHIAALEHEVPMLATTDLVM